MWANVGNAKAGMVGRLMQGTVGSMLSSSSADNAKVIAAHKAERAAEIAAKSKRDFQDEDEAAAYIQACYRGHVSRGWKAKLGRAATTIQKNWRGHAMRRMQTQAFWATRIQAVYRGRRIRASINNLSKAELEAALEALDSVALFEQVRRLSHRLSHATAPVVAERSVLWCRSRRR